MVEAYVVHKLPERRLIKNTITVGVNALELSGEVGEELFMLTELEIEDTLKKDVEFEL